MADGKTTGCEKLGIIFQSIARNAQLDQSTKMLYSSQCSDVEQQESKSLSGLQYFSYHQNSQCLGMQDWLLSGKQTSIQEHGGELECA